MYGIEFAMKHDLYGLLLSSVTNTMYKAYPGPEVMKLFSYSSQLSMNFFLLIILVLKLLTTANEFLLHTAVHENPSANKYENFNYFHIY